MSQVKVILKKLNVEEFKKTGKIEFLDNVHVSNIILVNEKKSLVASVFIHKLLGIVDFDGISDKLRKI